MGAHDKSAFEVNKLSKRLHRLTGQAIIDFNMIEEGDRVMVCMSGGKDSYAMLDILLSLRERAPIDFEVIAVNLDQGHPGFPKETLLARWSDIQNFPIIPCDLCGSQENLQRQQVKQMLNDWERRFPGRIESMFQALGNVVPSHLLDPKLYPFKGLQPTQQPDPNGDQGFDFEFPGKTEHTLVFAPDAPKAS
jgi:tRNA(Ile)-lysidine synthase TilS/MesJ